MRVDTGFAEGQRVTPFYDPMLAKVIVRGDDRAGAIAQLQSALAAFEIEGVKNNIPALQQVLVDARFVAGDVHTGLLGDIVAGQ